MVPHRVLAEIVKASGGSQAAVAREIGMSPAELSFILTGKRRASRVQAEMIEAWTGGRIPAHSWLTLKQQRKLARVGRRAA